ncbi:hypothetical protein LHJ74_26745 [Streptomyces sp. N2-109]|uniref:Uncharacterized protein n=1 Tax=Streptomyces gossypii TaxID=2883101 RepID=A0ABT2JZW7_9ACTN|nr:hypothetical protein [Streptomyces gossypii]MCT2593462.1 hypothetical protein [Streptomyces gossypii]
MPAPPMRRAQPPRERGGRRPVTPPPAAPSLASLIPAGTIRNGTRRCFANAPVPGAPAVRARTGGPGVALASAGLDFSQAVRLGTYPVDVTR